MIESLSAHTFTLKYTCWIHGLIESLILILPALARQCPQSDTIQRINDIFFELVLPPSVGKETNIFFPPPRILGAFLLLSGSTIRYWCFRELGRHFTFDVALLENHSLVTTGPYSVVRHPSYSGGVLLTTGSILWHATSGSWLIQSRFYTNPIAWVMLIPAIIVTGGSIIVGVVIRPEKEDELLEKEFGKKWEEWARRVPYQLFPGIY